MRNAPWTVIDLSSSQLARSMEILNLSLDGLLERTLRLTPNQRGQREFWVQSEDVSRQARSTVMRSLQGAFDALSLDAPEETLYAVLASFQGFFDQVRAQYAKRIRDVLVARAWQHTTGSADAHMLTRGGRRIDVETWSLLTSRKFLIDTYNAAQLEALVNAGATHFTVVHRDAGHEDDGLVVEIERYPEVADEIFHPRSGALIGSA